jgi:hypothetical protein
VFFFRKSTIPKTSNMGFLGWGNPTLDALKRNNGATTELRINLLIIDPLVLPFQRNRQRFLLEYFGEHHALN